METSESATSSVAQTRPTVGKGLPAFALPSTDGTVVRLRDFKQRRPLLLAFPHGPDCAACRAWLAGLLPQRGRLDELDVAVVVVMPASVEALRTLQTELDLPFYLLADEDAAAREVYVGTETGVALYAADRYGHCLARWSAGEADGFPPLAKPLTEFAFAEQEDCACGLPAWPEE